MARIPNPSFTEKYLQQKNPLGISSGFNSFGTTTAANTKKSPIADYFPTLEHFPSVPGNGFDVFNPDLLFCKQLPNWTPESVPAPEPWPGDYITFGDYGVGFFDSEKTVYFLATLTPGTLGTKMNFVTAAGTVDAFATASFPNVIERMSIPDALLLRGYWTRSGFTPTMNVTTEQKMSAVQSQPSDWETVYREKPFWKMGVYDIPRFRYFPELWRDDPVESIETFFIKQPEDADSSNLPFAWVPDYSADTMSLWLDPAFLRSLYQQHFNIRFIPTPEEYDAATAFNKRLHNLIRHKEQNPQSHVRGSAADIARNSFDLALRFREQSLSVIVKWDTVEDYLLDENGDRITTEFGYYSQIVATGEFPLDELMIEHNENQVEVPLPAWGRIENSYYTDDQWDANFANRTFWHTLSYFGGLSPFQIVNRPDAAEQLLLRIREIHLRTGRELFADGFFWMAEQPQ